MKPETQSTTVARVLQIFAWALSVAVVALAAIVWAGTWQWHLSELSIYQIFPIFGLVAFSTMWSQYVAGAAARFLNADGQALHRYFQITGFVVLVAILLHPGLLIWQLWRDGFGLPPDSYLQHYMASGLRWVAAIGTVCWLIFLAYEFRHKFGNRPWWRYMGYAVDAAVLGIFYHGLRLGSQLYSGWFRTLWFFYGAILVLVLLYGYIGSYRQARSKKLVTKLAVHRYR